MNEELAKSILKESIQPNNRLENGVEYINWPDYSAEHVRLDGHYSADELEAIAWWMKNKKAPFGYTRANSL